MAIDLEGTQHLLELSELHFFSNYELKMFEIFRGYLGHDDVVKINDLDGFTKPFEYQKIQSDIRNKNSTKEKFKITGETSNRKKNINVECIDNYEFRIPSNEKYFNLHHSTSLITFIVNAKSIFYQTPTSKLEISQIRPFNDEAAHRDIYFPQNFDNFEIQKYLLKIAMGFWNFDPMKFSNNKEKGLTYLKVINALKSFPFLYEDDPIYEANNHIEHLTENNMWFNNEMKDIVEQFNSFIEASLIEQT